MARQTAPLYLSEHCPAHGRGGRLRLAGSPGRPEGSRRVLQRSKKLARRHGRRIPAVSRYLRAGQGPQELGNNRRQRRQDVHHNTRNGPQERFAPRPDQHLERLGRRDHDRAVRRIRLPRSGSRPAPSPSVHRARNSPVSPRIFACRLRLYKLRKAARKRGIPAADLDDVAGLLAKRADRRARERLDAIEKEMPREP